MKTTRIRLLRLGSATVGVIAYAALAQVLTRSGASEEFPGAPEAPRAHPNVIAAAPGRVEGGSRSIDLAPRRQGVLAQLSVKEGERVTAGQEIGSIDCNDLVPSHDRALHALKASQAALDLLLAGTPREELAALAAAADAAAAARNLAEIEVTRSRSLFSEEGIISRAELDRAEANRAVTASLAETALERLHLAERGPLDEEIRLARARVAEARAGLEERAAELEHCVIRSPVDGLVLRRHREPGEAVTAGIPVVTLSRIGPRHIRAEVDERDISNVIIGQRARVSVDGVDGLSLTGRVVEIGTLMGRRTVLSGDPAEKGDRDVLEVVVRLEGSDQSLIVGLRATVLFLEEDPVAPPA